MLEFCTQRVNLYLFIYFICKIHNFNVHIVKLIGILYYFLRIQYSIDYEIVKNKNIYIFVLLQTKGGYI